MPQFCGSRFRHNSVRPFGIVVNACGIDCDAPPLPHAYQSRSPSPNRVVRTVTDRSVAIDFGASNTDIVVRAGGSLARMKVAGTNAPTDERVRELLAMAGVDTGTLRLLAVTGGNRRGLSSSVDGAPVVQVEEVVAIGRGGLMMANVERAIVTSAGSGTAVVSAEPDGCRHFTGTGVGGGTLVGLGRMLLGEANPLALDALAMAGNAAGLNLTIGEVLGGAIGSLPPDITAVNFGRVARAPVTATPQDTAAALVNMVGQVIAVIAINAALATRHTHIVIVGHFTDLPSVRDTLLQVGALYRTPLIIPEHGGYATAMGALIEAESLAVYKNG